MKMKLCKVSAFAQKESKHHLGSVNLWEWLLLRNEFTPLVLRLRATKDKFSVTSLRGLSRILADGL